jgi:hypothetical protein
MPSSTVRAAKKADTSRPASSAHPLWTPVSIAALMLLGAAAAVLRFSFLVRKPFWFDECFSVEVARLGWTDFCRLMWRREANMSLYYLLLRGWLHFGSSPFFIRSLSVIISLVTLPAIFWLASQLFDRRTGLLAVALMSFNAFHATPRRRAAIRCLYCWRFCRVGFSSQHCESHHAATAQDMDWPAFLPFMLIFMHCCYWQRSGCQ